MANFVAKVEGIIKSTPLVVFSKTTCGYCARAKNLLKTMNVSFDAVELDRVGRWLPPRTDLGSADPLLASHSPTD